MNVKERLRFDLKQVLFPYENFRGIDARRIVKLALCRIA